MADNPLRLLVIGAAWQPETFLLRLFNGLAEHDVDVTIAAASRPDAAWLSHPHHHWLRTPQWQGAYAARLLRLAGMASQALISGKLPIMRRLARAAQKNDRFSVLSRLLPFTNPRCDVLYFPWNSAAVEYLPLFDLGIPAVISCRGSQINVAPHNPARAALLSGLKTTFDRAAAIHCVSDAILQEAQQLGLDENKAVVIRPAVDPAFFTPPAARTPTGIFRIISTGSLIWRKSYDDALLAVKTLADAGIAVKYDIIGSGPEKERLLFTIRDLNLQNHVCLTGRLAPEAVRAQLQNADAFLLSSLSEGISNAALEAMSCGLPVVSTNCGGMREAITDGVEGWLVPLRDPRALADRLRRLCCDPALAQDMGQRARDRILRDFRLDQQVIMFENLFRQVASDR